jgi:hypothetical protein
MILNEADSLSRRLNSVPEAKISLSWDGEVPPYANLKRKSQPLVNDSQSNVMIANALQLNLKLVDLIREGYSQDSFYYGDEGEWMKDIRIEASDGLSCASVSCV